MIDYEDYKIYLERIGFSDKSLNTYPSYISQNKLDIFDTIKSYIDLSDDEKLIKFSNENNSFEEIFDKNHTFKSPDTFSDLRSGARRYKHYLQYKEIVKLMKEYDENKESFDLNGAYIYFKVLNRDLYPVKGICKKSISILELEKDFRTNSAKNILNKIFNMQTKNNIQFIDTRETIDGDAKLEITTLNQILYGPPGTGKTYNSINRALEIVDGEVPKSRSEAKKRFEALSNAGQIEFVTFHQSYGYEEFVEGIKANTIDGQISYDIEDGIFKKLALKSLKRNSSKVSKYKLHAKSLNIQAELIKDDKDRYRVLSGSKIRKGEAPSFQNYNYSALKSMVLKKAKYIEEDEFYILEEDYIFQSLSAASSVIFGRQSNGYNDWKEVIETDINIKKNELKNHILIIDEINRGNISKIFGELITLIEPSKRIGAEEEIRLRLPYSGDEFGVPSNLYIIGTMNTADRSIALMDTALRRRFEFVEMMPNVELLDFELDGINLKELLSTINARVEYLYDRDHTIGHAYFMELNENTTLQELNAVMQNKIIPLLQEYFYDDWEKIKLVLNDGFIECKKVDVSAIFDSNIDDEYVEEDKFSYSIVKEFEKEAYLRLCQRP